MNRKTKAMLMMVVCSTLWSTAGIFIKWIDWNPMIIAGIRGLISASVLYIYMRSTGRRVKTGRNCFLTAIGLGGSATLFTVANKLTTAANAIVLQFTNPIFILIIFAVFFGRKLRKGDIVTVSVKNTNQTIAQQLKNFFYKVVGKDTYTIASSHGGMVATTGR